MAGMRCAACGSAGLLPHLHVAGEAGEEGLVPTTVRFGTALADISRCPRCGHMQLDPMPEPEALSGAYAEAESAAYLEEEAGQRATARSLLARLARHCPPGDLLDVGCWLGFLLDEARSVGWRGVGVEPSRYAAAYAREHLSLHVHNAEVADAPLEPASFDAVVMADVIEHLPDPAATLDHLRSLLRPGGTLVLVLPDAGSRVARVLGRRWWSVIPTHVQYFTRGSLGTLLARRGWTVVSVATAPKTFTAGYYLSRLEGYARGPARTLLGLVSRAGVGRRLITPDFRDRMVILARRD